MRAQPVFCVSGGGVDGTGKGNNDLDDGYLSSALTLLLLILAHGAVNLGYSALVNVRPAALREQAEEGSIRARRILALVERFARLTITYQLTLTLLHFGIAVAAVTGLADPLAAQWPEVSPVLIYCAIIAAAVLTTLILGDLVPSALGSAHAERLSGWGLAIMRPLLFALRPVVALATGLSQMLSRVFGGDTLVASVTEEEIMTLVDAGQKEGAIESEEKEMILSVLQFGETMAYEVMVPRLDIVGLEINTSFDDALRRFIESGHSRIPVYRDTIDNIEGLLYAKDLLTVFHQNGESGASRPQSVRELMRPAYFVPETKLAGLLLKELQTSKIHMAIVVDEYGGTAGLVTIENLIEEIVGDIQDEYDINEEAEYVADGPDAYIIDASMNLDDINELLDVDLPTEDSSTLGGFIYSRVGRVPTIGEIVEDDDNDLMLRVESVDGRRIRKVRVERRHKTSDDGPAQPENNPAEPHPLDKAG